MIGSDILALAEEHYAVSFAVVLGVGALQGAILARGVRNRFPSLRRHARRASAALLIVFGANAAFNVSQFAAPPNLDASALGPAATLGDYASVVLQVLGIDGGFWSAVAIFVSLALVLFFRFAELPGIARHFVFAISAAALLAALAARFAVYVPTEFHIAAYAFYQAGITAGSYLVMRRAERAGDPL